ncbi:hypothetical protein AB7W40_19720 [Providencia rettgeri]
MKLGNLQKLAARYIPQQTVLWFRFKYREPDNLGHDKNQYHEPVAVCGSWQAVDVQDVQNMGFDTNQVYRRFYTSQDIKAVQRGTSPDYLVFEGKKYDVVGDADWYAQNGWKSILCIEAGAYDG